jgi:4-hydroxythreonine-4-phosphate dehydrogenase
MRRVLAVIRLAQNGLQLLGCKEPRIAVAGFNPHASEGGLFGSEETRAIIPAVEAAKAEGLNVSGPLPPDTVFVKALGGQYDVVVAMYHDQGHIPLKLVGFQLGAESTVSGINCTLGLPIIRTSVDHGTAFDKAGKNCSSEQSMIEAIEAAAAMAASMRSKNEF